jgi:phosphoglycolate phosphatase
VKRAVIFDFDGTIADSLPAVVEVAESLTNRPEHFTKAEIENFRHLSLIELLVVLNISKWKVPSLLLRGRKMMREYLPDIPLHTGIDSVIRELHDKGDKLYILSSNSTENVQNYLDLHDLGKYFAGVYGGASLLGKAPRLNKLIANESVDVTQSWYVGDETRDVIAARAVGLKSMSVTWGYNSHQALQAKQPDAIADTTDELLKGLK